MHHLLDITKEIICDCSLRNGAIVAANSDHESYPKEAQDYRYVWPRDAAFTIAAARSIGIDISEKFFSWLLTRAEGFREHGIIFQRYTVNGLRDPHFGHQYQPDQAGALLWAILSSPDLSDHAKETSSLLADGILSNWEKDHFRTITHDLWEERTNFPHLFGSFSYSLAACAKGLIMAESALGKKEYGSAAREMISCISKGTHYHRAGGRLPDRRIDASLLGLAWPFDVVPKDDTLRTTVRMIEELLMTPQGIMRYQHDEYDGTMHCLNHLKKGGGGWPLLTFWHHIVLHHLGETERAKEMIASYSSLFDHHIPEQVFSNDIQVSIAPLCWSHSMFALAISTIFPS